jgi:hypothetical protein
MCDFSERLYVCNGPQSAWQWSCPCAGAGLCAVRAHRRGKRQEARDKTQDTNRKLKEGYDERTNAQGIHNRKLMYSTLHQDRGW